jgi:phosphoribosylaminoimidazole-succinocarboxamide synthase
METSSPVVKAAVERTLPYVASHFEPAADLAFSGTDIPQSVLPHKRKAVGKVRDIYYCEDKVVLISTDRQSAFDRQIAKVPFKGQVLNLTSQWWFAAVKEKLGIPNAVISIPDPNVTIAQPCTPFPIEFVMRGYMTGSTSTSIWMNYDKGMREYCGHTLPDGLVKNQKLPMGNLLTPTTKDEKHDELISAASVVSEGHMTQADWDVCADYAQRLFAFGQEVAASRGLILVDTKYEFGRGPDGTILLIDEVHTPDSSRYWIADTYDERMKAGKSPENIDKELVRLWFTKNCDPYKDATLPAAPKDLVCELSRRYVMLYEMITGDKFAFPEARDVQQRVTENVSKAVGK